VVVVYKVDRLTRSLADFAKLVERFDACGVSFVSVTQQFNTTTSMGRLTLNVLLSFAQFEREVTGERIRDKIAASKRKGLWMGGYVPTGYQPNERTLAIDESQAGRIREIFRLYLGPGCVRQLKLELDRRGWTTPVRKTRRANMTGGRPFSRGHLYRMLSNPIYIGRIAHKEAVFDGQEAKAMAERIGSRSASERIEVLKRLVDRVTVAKQSITVAVRPSCIWSENASEGNTGLVNLAVSVELECRSTGSRLIVQASGISVARKPDAKLVALLTKAYDWFGRLNSGQGGGVIVHRARGAG